MACGPKNHAIWGVWAMLSLRGRAQIQDVETRFKDQVDAMELQRALRRSNPYPKAQTSPKALYYMVLGPKSHKI